MEIIRHCDKRHKRHAMMTVVALWGLSVMTFVAFRCLLVYYECWIVTFVAYDVCCITYIVCRLWCLSLMMFVALHITFVAYDVCRIWCLSHYDVCRQLYAQSFKRKLKIWAWQTPRFLNRFLWKSLSGQTFKGLSITRTKLQRLHAHFRAVRSKDSDSCFMFKTLSFRGQRTWAQQKFLRSSKEGEENIPRVLGTLPIFSFLNIFKEEKNKFEGISWLD